jgi:hypothetical protein
MTDLTEEALVETWRKIAAAPKHIGTYSIDPGPEYRAMQLAHNTKLMQDSIRGTLASLYLKDGE